MGGKAVRQSIKIIFETICKYLARAHLCTEIPLKIAIFGLLRSDSYRRFGTTYRSHIQVSKIQDWILDPEAVPSSSLWRLYHHLPIWIIIHHMQLLCTSFHRTIIETAILTF
jgi:hypothetical protein